MGDELIEAARALARLGLVDAFGHVSVRAGAVARITAPEPLGAVTRTLELPLGELDALPAGLPGEAWIHWALYRARPDVGAVCRAQPPSALPIAGAVAALHGQAALVGAPVPLFGDARLVRSRERALELAAAIGDAGGLVLRGNGAVTVGADLGAAVARMWILERSCEVNLRARGASPLSADEVASWQAAGDELLARLWAHLRG